MLFQATIIIAAAPFFASIVCCSSTNCTSSSLGDLCLSINWYHTWHLVLLLNFNFPLLSWLRAIRSPRFWRALSDGVAACVHRLSPVVLYVCYPFRGETALFFNVLLSSTHLYCFQLVYFLLGGTHSFSGKCLFFSIYSLCIFVLLLFCRPAPPATRLVVSSSKLRNSVIQYSSLIDSLFAFGSFICWLARTLSDKVIFIFSIYMYLRSASLLPPLPPHDLVVSSCVIIRKILGGSRPLFRAKSIFLHPRESDKIKMSRGAQYLFWGRSCAVDRANPPAPPPARPRLLLETQSLFESRYLFKAHAGDTGRWKHPPAPPEEEHTKERAETTKNNLI